VFLERLRAKWTERFWQQAKGVPAPTGTHQLDSALHIDLLSDIGSVDAHGAQTIPVQALQTTFF
jgi:hypothetical protein